MSESSARLDGPHCSRSCSLSFVFLSFFLSVIPHSPSSTHSFFLSLSLSCLAVFLLSFCSVYDYSFSFFRFCPSARLFACLFLAGLCHQSINDSAACFVRRGLCCVCMYACLRVYLCIHSYMHACICRYCALTYHQPIGYALANSTGAVQFTCASHSLTLSTNQSVNQPDQPGS